MTTAAITSRDALAQRIIDNVGSLTLKLRELADDIRLLWIEFERLPEGETILGCQTKKEFCEKHLHRTPRAVQYLLNGRLEPSEQCSLPYDEIDIDLTDLDDQECSNLFDGLNSLADSALRAFNESWKAGGDLETNLRAWQTARDVGKGMLDVVTNEWGKVADSHNADDLPTIVAIARCAQRLQNFHGVLHIQVGCEMGRIFKELANMGISTKGAVALINLSKEELETLCERIEELRKNAAREG